MLLTEITLYFLSYGQRYGLIMPNIIPGLHRLTVYTEKGTALDFGGANECT